MIAMKKYHFDSKEVHMDNGRNTLRIRNSRMMVINGEITNELCTLACIELLEMESEDSEKDITILLNSPGGDIQAGFMLIDTMRMLSVDVEVISIGLAASMGAMILMAGTPGKRRALPHSRIMLHQPLGGSSMMMQISDFEIQAKEMQRTRKEIFKFISDCTGKPYKKVNEDCDRNFWMNSMEAMEYGIIDNIVSKETR